MEQVSIKDDGESASVVTFSPPLSPSNPQPGGGGAPAAPKQGSHASSMPLTPGAPNTKQREEYMAQHSTYDLPGSGNGGGGGTAAAANPSALRRPRPPSLSSAHDDPPPSAQLPKQRSISGAIDQPMVPYDGPAVLPPAPSVRGIGVGQPPSIKKAGSPKSGRSNLKRGKVGKAAPSQGSAKVAGASGVRADQIGFRIHIRKLRGFDVPDSDADGTPTDPYVMVEMLETDTVTLESTTMASTRTGVAAGSPIDPVWGHADNLLLTLKAGTPGAVALLMEGTFPTLRVSIMDADDEAEDEEDDLLGQAEVTLEGENSRERTAGREQPGESNGREQPGEGNGRGQWGGEGMRGCRLGCC